MGMHEGQTAMNEAILIIGKWMPNHKCLYDGDCVRRDTGWINRLRHVCLIFIFIVWVIDWYEPSAVVFAEEGCFSVVPCFVGIPNSPIEVEIPSAVRGKAISGI